MREKLFRMAFAVFAGLIIIVAAVFSTGCGTKIIHLPDGSVMVSREPMPQVGVIVTVVNNCAARVAVESGGILKDPALPFGKSNRLPISTSPFSSLGHRSITVVAKAYNATNHYLGSATRLFFADTYLGTYEETWTLDQLDSPRDAQCEPPRSP